jgi:hypothetical protein
MYCNAIGRKFAKNCRQNFSVHQCGNGCGSGNGQKLTTQMYIRRCPRLSAFGGNPLEIKYLDLPGRLVKVGVLFRETAGF